MVREAVSGIPARAAIVLVALAILWRVIEVNVVVYGEDGRPRLAARASEALEPSPSDLDAAASILHDHPTQIAALLVVAREFEREGRAGDAARAYDAAYRVAPLDREVLDAASGFFLRQGRTAEALALLDRLVAHYQEARAAAFPVMAASLASGRDRDTWKRILEADPPWAGAFVMSECNAGADPSLVMPLFLARASAAAARPEEAACLVDHLRRAGRWDEAYQAWLNTLPRERLADVGAIFNGSFEVAPSGVGFDWVVAQGQERASGHTVEFARAIGVTGARALKVSYNGKRQSGTPVLQFLALPPGRYEVTGQARPEGLRVGRGVRWTVRCAADGTPGAILAQSERFIGSSEWRSFTFALEVTPACRGQVLQLEPAGNEESAAYIAGVAWFDDLAARRIP